MLNELKSGLKETLYFISVALRALVFWRRDPPIETTEELARFAETRSKYVSQITLFGYLKTRTGTRYSLYFDDEIFANSINIAKWEIYLACLCDVSIYLAGRVGRLTSLANDEQGELAINIFDVAIRDEAIPVERPQGFDDIRASFEARARATSWLELTEGEAPFTSSVSALVKWAPVADELKKYDVVPVRNSMRFRWKYVRDQLKSILDADAITADWRANRSG